MIEHRQSFLFAEIRLNGGNPLQVLLHARKRHAGVNQVIHEQHIADLRQYIALQYAPPLATARQL